jgi:hypothetical protein
MVPLHLSTCVCLLPLVILESAADIDEIWYEYQAAEGPLPIFSFNVLQLVTPPSWLLILYF